MKPRKVLKVWRLEKPSKNLRDRYIPENAPEIPWVADNLFHGMQLVSDRAGIPQKFIFPTVGSK